MPDPTDLFKPPATPVTTQEKPVTAQEMFAPSKRPSRGKAPKHVQPDNNSEHYKRTVDWLASGGKTPIEQPPAPPANVPPGPIEQMVGSKTALEYPSGAKGAMPEYVRRGMLARLASQAVPQSLQDPRNWPEDYKQKLLDPSSDEARMNAYDQDKYGRPTFGYVSDPDRDKYKRQVDLEKKPGTIYSEAKAMDAELSKRGIDLQKSDRDALIGYIWLHNQMKSDDDPVMPGSGVQAAMMAAHGDIGHLKELIDQGRARRGAEALYAGEKPLDRDAEALLSRTRGETSPAEMTRLLGPLGDSGNVNLTSGEQAQSSDTPYIKDFNKRMGIGTYAQEMGVPESMRPRDLARAGAALDNPQFGQSGLMKSAGYEKDSVEAQMLEAVPALAKVPDVNWGALAGQALVESFATGNPSAGLLRVLSDPGARGDVAALGSVMMRPMSTMRHLGARLSDEELSSLPDNKSWIVSAGESTGDFIGQMALMHLAGVPIKGMAIASQILQTLPDFTLSMYEHGGDAEKAVSQTLGGLASGFDPSIPFDATKPVAQRVSTGLNLGMMALGLTLNGLKTSGKLQSKAPSTKGVNLTDAEWANLPAGLLHQGERIRSEINNGLLRANGHDIESAHPDLASALTEQSHGAASVLIRAAQLIERRGGATADDTLAKIKFGFNGELNGVTPEVEAAIKEVVPEPAAVDNPPAPTGAVVNENGHVEIGTTNFWMPNIGKRTAKIVVMPLDELITSHKSDTFEINPNYPTDMQPRDRTREAYRMQVQDIASKFDHEQHLEDYHKLDDGSPAILPDGTVVSGNGRAMALQKLAAGLGNKKAWAEYQARVKAMAGGKADGMKNPVIVRMLDEMPLDHARAIAEEANRGSGMTMGATEEASIASGKIPDNFWQSLTPVGTSIDTTINSPKNRGIVTRWLQSFPKTEQGRYLAPDGSLNMDGKTAFKRAAVADLLGPDGKLFMERLFETNDESARLASGVFQALPELIKAKSPELAKALNALLDEFDRYRTFHDEQGFSWDQYKLQGTLHNVPPELTSVFHELGDAVSKGSANKVSDVLTNLVNQGEFREIANKLAGQESLLSNERSRDAFLVVRNFYPSFGKLIENLGGKDLGDSYYAVKNGPEAKMLIDQAGVQVDRTRTNDYNKRYADQSGLFGEEQATKEPPPPEPTQESLFSKGTERTPDKTTTRAEITFDNETGNALVQLGPGATVAEVAHESAHFIERHLTPDMLRQVSDALGFGEKWTTENKERFARAFELYLTEKASVPGADPVMASLANAVRDVYERRKVFDDAGKQVKSTPEGSVKWQAEPHIGEGELSVPDSLRSIFDDMTAHPESWPGMVAAVPSQETENATVPTEPAETQAEPQATAERPSRGTAREDSGQGVDGATDDPFVTKAQEPGPTEDLAADKPTEPDSPPVETEDQVRAKEAGADPEPDIAQVYAKARAELDAGTITPQEFNKRFDAWRSEERGDQTESGEFKQWFGESKAVDESGKPLRLYHGTKRTFDFFNAKADHEWPHSNSSLGFFLTDNPKEAGEFAGAVDDGRPHADSGARTVPVYVRMENPFIAEDWDALRHEISLRDPDIGEPDPSFAAKSIRGYDAKLWLREQGYDGVIFTHEGYRGSGKWYIPFDSRQIKSAIGNRGTFDRSRPEVLFSQERGAQEFNKRFDAWRSEERGSGGEDFRVGPGFRLRSVDVITEKMKGPMMFRDFLQMLRNNGVKETEINDLDIGGSALIIAEGNGGKVDPGRILSKIKENAPTVYSERRLARLFSDSSATPEERAKVDDLRDGIKSLFDKLSKSGGTQSLMTAARQYLSNRGVFDLRGEELKLRQRVTDIIHHEYDNFGYDSRHQAYADIERAMHLSGESAEESLRGFDYKHGMDGSSVPQDLVDAINKHFEFEQKHNALLSMIDRDGHVSKYAVERLFPYSAAETEGLHRQLENLQKQKQNIQDKYRPEYSDKKLKLPNGDNYRETVVSSPYAGYSHFGQHFSDYGYNFHARATDRVVDGRPTTFLEEVQSDAHQAARRLGGYAEPGKGLEHNEGKPNYTPFQKTWERIAIDMAILDAIEKGNEQIAWTSGEVHADRYFEDETGMEFDSTPGASERNAKRSRGFQAAYDERLVNIANDIGKKYGVRAEKTTVEGTPAWKFTIPDELSKEYTDKGPTLFSQERGAQENFKKARHEATRYLTYGMPRLTEENPSVATAAGRFGQTRGDVMRIITTAATVMKRITGKAETIGEFRKFASVDRLYGIEARWRGFADTVDNLDEAGFLKDYKKLAETADVASAGTSAHVQTMVDNGHADIARMLLKNVFNDAAVRVGKNADSLMTPEQYEAYKSAPEYSKLKDAWIEHAQDELKKIHLANDGVLTDALGPEGLHVPLIGLDVAGEPVKGSRKSRGSKGQTTDYDMSPEGFHGRVSQDVPLIGLDVAGEPVKGPRRSRGSNGKTTVVVGGRSVLADPPNLSNKMATGLSPGGYDMSPEGFHGRVLRDAFFSNKGAFLDSLKDAGLVREVDDATFGRMKKEEAMGNLQLNPVSGDNVPAIAIESGGKRYVIAEHAAKEIKHLLDTDDPLRYSDDLSQVISKLTKFQLAGIIEPLIHSRNLFSALVSLTPYLNKDVMSMSIGNTSVTKLPYAIWRASKTDVFSQEGTRMMKKLSDAGALPNRTMEVTVDKGLAGQTGANVPGFAERTNAPLSSTAFLFGPTGVDMRVRVMLGHIAEQMGLEGRQFRDFVNQAGAYNPAYASVAERFFKRTGIGPFYTAGQAFNIGGAKSLIGKMPGARVQERVLQQISGGMASAMATWYVASILITGKPPAPDEKIGEVPIGGGQSINTLFLTPLVERGLRTTGIKAGLDAHAQGANNDQAFDAAFRQVFNAWSHPMLSGAPAHMATTAIAGVAPYMTSTTDVTGRQGMSFLRSVPDVGGGPKQVAYNLGYAALNINPLIGKIAEATGMVPPPYKPHAGEMPEDEVLDLILSNSLPGLVKHRSDPADTRERYQKKAKATASAIDESNWEKIQGAMSKESIEIIKEFSLSPSPKKSRGEPQEAFDARVKAAATAWDAALKQIPSMGLTKEQKRAIAEQMTSEVFKKQKS